MLHKIFISRFKIRQNNSHVKFMMEFILQFIEDALLLEA